jgi:hypothetical protein
MHLMHLGTGVCYKLNLIATLFWEQILLAQSNEEAISNLLREIEGEKEEIVEAYANFKSELLKEELIKAGTHLS